MLRAIVRPGAALERADEITKPVPDQTSDGPSATAKGRA